MTEWSGYVELNYQRGIQGVEFRRDVYQDKVYVNVWVDEDLADDVESIEDFESDYGLKLYDSLEDYKQGNFILAREIWSQILNG